MLDPEVARMKPPARESLVGRRLVLEVALHYDVATEHHFAHRFSVGGHGDHRFRIDDIERLERMIADALTRLQMRLALRVERVPLVLPVVDDRWAVNLGQAR